MPTPAYQKYVRKTLKWLCIILVVFGSTLFLGYRFAISHYTGSRVSGILSARSGREFSIDGPLQIKWNWTQPRIILSRVRIANAPGGSAPYFADIEEIDMRIKIWKLLFGRTEIPNLQIIRPLLNFERKNDGHKNWEFQVFSGGNISTKVALSDERGDTPLIGNLRITGGKISYKDAPRRLEMDLDLDTAKGANQEDLDKFTFHGTGKMEGQAFSLEAEGGSLELLRDTTRDFPLDMTVTIGKTKLSINGTFADPIQLRKLDAKLHLNGDNLADLFYLMHIPFPPTPSYDLQGHLKKDGQKWPFSGFSGRLGHSDLSGNVTYDTRGERPLLAGTLHSRRLDVADLGGLIGLPQHTDEKKQAQSGHLLPDTPLDLKRLRAGDMDLILTAAKLNAPGWPLSAMSTHIMLKAGVLQFDPLRFGLAGGAVKGRLALDGRNNLPRVDTSLDLQELNIKRFFGTSSFADFSSGQFSGRIQLQGAGLSLADVLAVSDGRIVMTMAGGKASLLLVEGSDLDIAEMLPLFFGKDKTTEARCAVGDFPVINGQLQSRIFIFDTDDTNLKGEANINLRNETIDAMLDARPKDVSLLSLQSRIRLSGKFSDPRVSIDPIPLGLRGAAAVALGSVLPPAAILPFVEIGDGKDSDCARLLQAVHAPLKTTQK